MPGASETLQVSPVPKRPISAVEAKLLPPTVPVMPEVPLSEELPQAAAKATTARRAILRMKSPVQSGVGGAAPHGRQGMRALHHVSPPSPREPHAPPLGQGATGDYEDASPEARELRGDPRGGCCALPGRP